MKQLAVQPATTIASNVRPAVQAEHLPGGQAIGDVRRIVVLRALFLGDLICSLPALRALRRRFPRAEVTLIGLPWAEEVVRRSPEIDRLLPFPGYPGIAEVPYDAERTAAWLAALRTTPPDLAIQMHGNGSASNGFVAELGARLTLGYRASLDDARLDVAPLYDPAEHEIRRWLTLVAAIGAATDDLRPEWPVLPREREHAAVLLEPVAAPRGPLVVLHPGAKEQARRWPIKCFAALGDTLAATYGARIVITGGQAEADLGTRLQGALHGPALNLVGRTDLGSFAAVIDAADLLISNDTGASHVAAAVGTPSVVLFGPTRPEQWAPLDRQRHRVIDAVAVTGIADGARALTRLEVPVVAAQAVHLLGEVVCDDYAF